MSPRCAELSQSLTPRGQRVLAAFIAGRLAAGQLHDELIRASSEESQPFAEPPRRAAAA